MPDLLRRSTFSWPSPKGSNFEAARGRLYVFLVDPSKPAQCLRRTSSERRRSKAWMSLFSYSAACECGAMGTVVPVPRRSAHHLPSTTHPVVFPAPLTSKRGARNAGKLGMSERCITILRNQILLSMSADAGHSGSSVMSVQVQIGIWRTQGDSLPKRCCSAVTETFPTFLPQVKWCCSIGVGTTVPGSSA